MSHGGVDPLMEAAVGWKTSHRPRWEQFNALHWELRPSESFWSPEPWLWIVTGSQSNKVVFEARSLSKTNDVAPKLISCVGLWGSHAPSLLAAWRQRPEQRLVQINPRFIHLAEQRRRLRGNFFS